jgi:hypothetical protein
VKFSESPICRTCGVQDCVSIVDGETVAAVRAAGGIAAVAASADRYLRHIGRDP